MILLWHIFELHRHNFKPSYLLKLIQFCLHSFIYRWINWSPAVCQAKNLLSGHRKMRWSSIFPTRSVPSSLIAWLLTFPLLWLRWLSLHQHHWFHLECDRNVISDLLCPNLHFIKILVDSYEHSNWRRIALPYYELLYINIRVLFSCECPIMPSKVPHPRVKGKGEEADKKKNHCCDFSRFTSDTSSFNLYNIK